MIFFAYLIATVLGFFCIWLSVIIFAGKLEDKILRSVILAILISAVSLIFSKLGVIGFIISLVINFILIMKILGLNFLSAIFFTLGLNLLSSIVLFGLAGIFPNTPRVLPQKDVTINSTAPNNSVADNSNVDNLAKESPLIDTNTVVTSVETSAPTSIERLTNPINDRNISRIMMWSGKVNQHWDLETGAWLTDPDGRSGAQLDRLTYCKKFYPNTTSVVEYKKETINTWKSGGNYGDYTNTIMSYRCVLEGKSI